MRTSESIAKLAEALSKAQGELDDAKKDSENPHFKSRYADLAAVRKVTKPVLAKHGLSVVQVPVLCEQGPRLETRLMHISGEWIEGELPLIFQQNNMQGLVSAITYARRTSLAAITGVAPVDEDDDAEAAVGRASTPAPVAQAAPRPQPVAAPKPVAAPRPVAVAKPAPRQEITADDVPF